MKLTHCPSTLVEGYETYSPVALRNLFAGKKVSHILPYDSPEKNEEDNEKFYREYRTYLNFRSTR